MKIAIETLFISLLVIGVIFAICYAGVSLEYHLDSCIWNNGVCDCGGKFEFVNASSVKGAGTSYTYYFYSCNDCGNVIKMDFVMREENK